MQYQARAAAVEAERVTLAGQEMVAVAVAGKVALVPADVFDVFFALREAVADMKELAQPKEAPTKRIVPKPKAADMAKVNQFERSAELRSIVLKALGEVGPLTTAELGDRCYPAAESAKARYQGAWCVLKKLAEEHLVEKRDDLKWHLKTK